MIRMIFSNTTMSYLEKDEKKNLDISGYSNKITDNIHIIEEKKVLNFGLL